MITMQYTATVSAAEPNYVDPTTFYMTVQFVDTAGNDVHHKEYCVPVSNTATENQALIQADIDSFSASFTAANQAVTSLNAVQGDAISVASELDSEAQAAITSQTDQAVV